MKKILIQGIKPKKVKYIYKIWCNQCGCLFECEIQDFDFVREDKGKLISGTIKCPCCNTELDKYFDSIEKRTKEE